MAKVNSHLFNKFNSAIKLPLKQAGAGDGSEAEVDIREDEEQSVKQQEIIDLLVAAGYFRARIKGLSPFDKIVGGMTWCIQSCSVDIDVDLLFQENSTIGQKIALTEKIVAVLQKMKCPHRIEPHQIQGLDFIHIFPVIQWLVKKSMEYRQEMAAFMRSYAVKQFEKEFPDVNQKKEQNEKKIVENISLVQQHYRPRRIYKRKNALPDDTYTRLLITLLEYEARDKIQTTSINQTVESSSLGEQIEEEHDVIKLLNNLTLMQEDENYSFSNKDKEELAKYYAALHNELKNQGTSVNSLQTLNNQKTILEDDCNKLSEQYQSLVSNLNDKNDKLLELQENQKKAANFLKEMEKVIEDPETVKETERLVILGEKLRNQELQFREYCKQELIRLQNMIEEVKTAKPEKQIDSSQLNQKLQKEEEKLKELRLILADKVRAVALLERRLDEIPTSPELAQYQKRFIELYNQVAAKHKETKQYYTLYNTLVDTRTYINKELSLLNSISDSYLEAMSSVNSKAEFLSQIEKIVAGVKQSRCKVEGKLVEERHKRDELSHTLQSLIDQQRKYVSVVKQLSVEFRKHEILLNQVQS